MDIDVIILSYAKDDIYTKMNNNCIDSINNSSDEIKFNILLIETNSDKNFNYSQQNVTVIQPNVEFGYNKFLNIGLEKCSNEWILISNNDMIYEKNFADYMIRANSIYNNILSMSPMDDKWKRHNSFDRHQPIHYGYRLQYELTAWSVMINRKVIDIIGKFDEKFTFWYQDNDFVNNLITHNIKHALITNSKAHHLFCKSNKLVKNWGKMVSESHSYFTEKWKVKLDEIYKNED